MRRNKFAWLKGKIKISEVKLDDICIFKSNAGKNKITESNKRKEEKIECTAYFKGRDGLGTCDTDCQWWQEFKGKCPCAKGSLFWDGKGKLGKKKYYLISDTGAIITITNDKKAVEIWEKVGYRKCSREEY
ncbi:MAG: hypothetical protein AB1567_06705, partial [bacterium]